nr:tRNA-uridine aminocarboxypropyltransferase [Shewanella sp. NIFS-20-20]
MTHERELSRLSNTGQWVLATLPQMSQRVIWSRKQPDQALIADLDSGRARLVFPASEMAQGQHSDTLPVSRQSECALKSLVIIDATWQEARKMWRQSPYLKRAPLFPLMVDAPSSYLLRRNQIQGGLSTAECVINLLQQLALHDSAAALISTYEQYNSQ